ncbi:hypothetical protein MIDIC_140028 [Alphaproteobacteria bacterium]
MARQAITHDKKGICQNLQERLSKFDARWSDEPRNKYGKTIGELGKTLDKGYIYGKAIFSAYTLLGEEKFAQYFPQTYLPD